MSDTNKVSPRFFYSQNGDKEEDEKLLEPLVYMVQFKQVYIYQQVVSFMNYWLKISPDKLQQIGEIMCLLNNSAILFDDILDSAILRGGFPVTHSIYGISYTINTANYAQFIGFEKLLNLHPAAIKTILEDVLEFNRGQGMEIYWKDNFICPTEKEFKVMAGRKSGALLKIAVKLMQLFSTCEEDFSSVLNLLGFHRQIHDDYCNLYLDKDPNDKSYCDDLTEGKFNFLIVHALTHNPDDKQIINILKQRTTSTELKRHCVKLLENYGSFKYTRDVLEELDKKLRSEIERLGGNPLFVKILDDWKNKMLKTHV